ncbi:DUF541 domain-containing protein [Sandaracinobacter neustonicus]|uniref:DUF541 domain-containing protein n=1 Tax=Sandaracinobacter neustonicus TaxID=1715348 RepID=A0A501XUW2_9SPHN|nr:SIMPL domain-containing protein [Sandaracinobacter neustonicus]TPE64478.1 DUF541 domain-containing protein [Sandaracinobacter neustonicus]
MKSSHIAAIVAAATAATAAAAQPAAQTTPAPATLDLSATAEVQAAPDIASIGAGVVTQAPEAQAALSANSEKMVRVVAALKKAGVADRDIQTSGLNLQPQFRYEQNQPPQLTGFTASNRVQVTLRDLKGAGKVIDTLVKEGANQIDGPDFRVAAPEPLLDKARAEAVAKARARAELYAQAAGLKVVRITEISEGFQQQAPSPKVRTMAMEAAADTPVSPGEIGLSATVTMAFELAPR